jgi:hypothetical protein
MSWLNAVTALAVIPILEHAQNMKQEHASRFQEYISYWTGDWGARVSAILGLCTLGYFAEAALHTDGDEVFTVVNDLILVVILTGIVVLRQVMSMREINKSKEDQSHAQEAVRSTNTILTAIFEGTGDSIFVKRPQWSRKPAGKLNYTTA